MDHFVYLCFMFIFVMLSCLFLAALCSPAWKRLTSCLYCVLWFCTFPYGVSGQVGNLIVLIPAIFLPLYFYLHLCNKKLKTETQMMICTTAMAPAMFAKKNDNKINHNGQAQAANTHSAITKFNP